MINNAIFEREKAHIRHEIKVMAQLQTNNDIVVVSGTGPQSVQVFDSRSFKQKFIGKVLNRVERACSILENE